MRCATCLTYVKKLKTRNNRINQTILHCIATDDNSDKPVAHYMLLHISHTYKERGILLHTSSTYATDRIVYLDLSHNQLMSFWKEYTPNG